MILSDECYSEIYTQSPPAACWNAPDLILPMSSRFSRSRSAPICRACGSASPPATGNSSRCFTNCAMSRPPRCRCRCSMSRSPPMATRPMSRKNRRLYRIKFDLADQILGRCYGYRRPAGGFCVWLDVSAHGGDEGRDREALPGRRRARGARKLHWRAGNLTAATPAPATFGWRWCRAVKPPAEALHRLVEILD